MPRVPDREFDYKLNIFFGCLFLTGGFVYLKFLMTSNARSDLFKSIASFVLAVAWFSLAFYNYKKSKKVKH